MELISLHSSDFDPASCSQNSLDQNGVFHVKHTAPLHLPFSPDAALVLKRRQAPQLVPGHLQSIALEDTHTFGTLYSLDGDAMAAEADEFMLHESLVHIPALSHPDLRRALVLGGGDGASARELLKHPGLDSIIVAELDPGVVVTIRRLLPALPQDAFDNGRVDLRIGDAAHTLASAYQAGERFDVILFDLTEADDPACAHLHQPDFLQLCAASLAPRGIIHVQLGSPFYQAEKVASLYRRLESVFPKPQVSLIHVPLYGGPWLLACCSGNAQPEPDETTLVERMTARCIHGLRYYNPALHLASRALPNYIRDLLA